MPNDVLTRAIDAAASGTHLTADQLGDSLALGPQGDQKGSGLDLAGPSAMISSSTADAWSAVRWVPEAAASIARVRTSLGIEEVSEHVLAARREH